MAIHILPSAVSTPAAEPAFDIAHSRTVAAGCEAAWELDALIDCMLEQVLPTCWETDREKVNAMLARGRLLRMKRLTSVLMSIAGGEGNDPDVFEEEVFGRIVGEEVSHG